MSSSPDPTVLIPGAGGPAAVCAIKSLRRARYRGRIVSTDSDPLSPGLFLADASAVLPPVADPQFFDRALELIAREQVSLILPTSGFDTFIYSQRKTELRQRGVIAIVSDYDVVETCRDKAKFHRRVHGRFPLPETALDGTEAVSFPCFVKPVRGKGSRGAALCRNADELARHLQESSGVLVQEYLPGEEYSIDVLSDLDGKPLVAVPRARLLVRDGISMRGRVFHDRYIEEACLDLARFLGLAGATCMQMKRAADGNLKFIEVNPRMGGSTIFATLAGVNFAQLQVEIAMGRPVEIPAFRDLTVLRYHEEITIEG